jgi:hypothetical protein
VPACPPRECPDLIAGAAVEEDYFKGKIRRLTEELEKERERSKGLVGRIAIMEANAARPVSILRRYTNRCWSRCGQCRGLALVSRGDVVLSSGAFRVAFAPDSGRSSKACQVRAKSFRLHVSNLIENRNPVRPRLLPGLT